MNYSYEKFHWEKYVLNNPDLLLDNIVNLEKAWQHWKENGEKEKRLFYNKNDRDVEIEKINPLMIHLINHFVDNECYLYVKRREPPFDWVSYVCSNTDLFIDRIRNEKELKKHWEEIGIKQGRVINGLHNYHFMIRHEFLNFDWKRYLNVNEDLKEVKNEEDAWYHWLIHGVKEERATYLINNSKIHNGRLGNLFFVNMVCHFLSLKMNIKFNYKYYQSFQKLGIDLFVGSNTYKNSVILNDKDFYEMIYQKKYEKKNIIVTNEMWCQKREFCFALKYYFSKIKIRNSVIQSNVFKDRYFSNNDLFIHLRLGDIKSRVDNIYDCYDRTIDHILFNKGFISSDSIDHPVCIKLIEKYSLIPINKDEIETIMFGSTCNHIILSGGTFSWLIGFLAFFSKTIYYPEIENKWYGDIFVFPEWKVMR